MLPSCVLVSACTCQNRGGTCLRNLLSAFNLPSVEKGRPRGKTENHSDRGKVINHTVEKGVTNLSPISKNLPLFILFCKGSFAFSLPEAEREQPSRSWLHRFTCVCGRRSGVVYVWFNSYCLNTVGVDNFHFGFLGYLWGLRCREKCQHSFLT